MIHPMKAASLKEQRASLFKELTEAQYQFAYYFERYKKYKKRVESLEAEIEALPKKMNSINKEGN